MFPRILWVKKNGSTRSQQRTKVTSPTTPRVPAADLTVDCFRSSFLNLAAKERSSRNGVGLMLKKDHLNRGNKSLPSKELHSEPRSDSFTHLFEGITWRAFKVFWPVGVMLDISYWKILNGAFNSDSTNKNRDSTIKA